MDEPLGALDKQLRESMQYEIKHLHAQLGLTVVYVTHDQGEALTMSDRVAVFDRGVIQQLATPQELYERPANAFVAGFVGETNRLAGAVVRRDGGFCEVDASGALFRAVAVDVGEVGAPAVLSVRPERIVIGEGTDAHVNRADGRVEEVIYHGDHLRVRARLLGRDEIVVKVPNRDGPVAIRPGDAVRLAWRAEDCRALEPR
jgi:putative spermidine/putrescine transport system ATP-binding protein